MTDKELLTICQAAFEAMPIAAKARKILKKLDQVPVSYAGNGSHILAAVMAKMIDEHLQGGL